MLVCLDLADRLVLVRIELRTGGCYRLQALLLKRVGQSVIDQLYPTNKFITGATRCRSLESPLEIVQDRQQSAYGLLARILSELHPFPLGAFAEIIELRLKAKDTVLQFGIALRQFREL